MGKRNCFILGITKQKRVGKTPFFVIKSEVLSLLVSVYSLCESDSFVRTLPFLLQQQHIHCLCFQVCLLRGLVPAGGHW